MITDRGILDTRDFHLRGLTWREWLFPRRALLDCKAAFRDRFDAHSGIHDK